MTSKRPTSLSRLLQYAHRIFMSASLRLPEGGCRETGEGVFVIAEGEVTPAFTTPYPVADKGSQWAYHWTLLGRTLDPLHHISVGQVGHGCKLYVVHVSKQSLVQHFLAEFHRLGVFGACPTAGLPAVEHVDSVGAGDQLQVEVQY